MAAKTQITSTYRIQFWRDFKFQDLESLIPYLKKLGVDSVYASPVLKSTTGSTHCYDVTDPREINGEMGGEEELEKISAEVHSAGMKWIQDAVLNHMAVNAENVFLQDIFAYGRKSFFWNLFDFMFTPESDNRIDLFILGDPYEDTIRSGSIKIVNPESPVLKVYNHELSISGNGIAHIKSVSGNVVSNLSLEKINSDPERLHSFLLDENFRLGYWRSGIEGTNYRRFFSVNSLIALRTENPRYFGVLTQKLFSLLQRGIVDGFRLDHIDGLYSPENFLIRFARGTGNAPVWVEKVLTGNEKLRKSWKTNGTTGYDFLYFCTYLFVDRSSEKKLKEFYRSFTGEKKTPDRLTYENKKIYLRSSFSHEVDYLAHIFYEFLQDRIYGQDITEAELRIFIEEMMASFSIYRTYLSPASRNMEDMRLIRDTISKAGKRTGLSEVQDAMIKMVDSTMLHGRAMHCFQKIQQFIPATIAKSVEDKLFFQYNVLISLNEVGCVPQKFSISSAEFHRFMKYRSHNMPLTMNTLSTHDTKLGEDIRSRITSLSQIPDSWIDSVKEWHQVNLKYKSFHGKKEYPSQNHEYYFYQILLACAPDRWDKEDRFSDRIHGQMIKAAREGGGITDWNNPNTEYEEAMSAFIDGSMADEHFRTSFMKLFRRTEISGMVISISENIIKLTAPGIPDIYQGSESMNLSFTDPDNRGRVDFSRSVDMLEKVKMMHERENYKGIMEGWSEGSLKIFINHILLNFRKTNQDLFLSGDYEALHASGTHMSRIMGYMRRKGNKIIIVIVPLSSANISGGEMPTGMDVWHDTSISIPENAWGHYADIFTGKKISVKGSVMAGDAFSIFPFSVLIFGEGENHA